MTGRYKQAENYLNSFLNYEKESFFPYKRFLKLERMYLLLKQLQIPYQDLKVIHIAGTKGKGSTAHFCAYLLAASGFKAGLFTSPHLFDFRERIKVVKKKQTGEIKESLISEFNLAKIVEGLKRKMAGLRLPENLGPITFFEFSTALSFEYFLQKEVDFVILESGLGGKLDSTNVVNPLACIITHIGYDHMDKLGKKLAEIAGEKAGIIKKNIPLICSPQRPASLRAIKSKCRMKNALFLLWGRDFEVKNLRIQRKYTLFDFGFDSFILKGLKIYLKGRQQVENASLAIAAISLLERRGVITGRIDYRGGLKHCFLPGRFEVVNKLPLIIVDIAHNVSSFLALRDNLKTYFPNKKIILIFSCAKDKDAGKMLKSIDYSYLILTSFDNPRSQSPLELKKIVKEKSVYLTINIKDAFKQASAICKKDWVIVVSGSLFLVSEAKRALQSQGNKVKYF
ncbi:MAG: bifunctional folylpolyglutamate synthase/dihydrofolate synthase [Candidatus Omnitrophica bacterium]|nr:bifunctional folylpolyglutamate synthase/dihydrofolate synthase [Candidatus Omnitrophota bacterium]